MASGEGGALRPRVPIKDQEGLGQTTGGPSYWEGPPIGAQRPHIYPTDPTMYSWP